MSQTTVINKNLIFIVRISVALFLALQVWVWLRFAGALWVNDSLHLMESLLKSVSSLKTSLEGFLVFVVPALVASFVIHKRFTASKFVFFSVTLGVLFSIFYLFSIAPANFTFFKQQFWVYVAAGSLSGLAYGVILEIPWVKSTSPDNTSPDSRTRRRLVGSIGLIAGTTGLFGSLMGPFYFWRNQNKFVDVHLESLEEGQLIVAKVGNKPVWVIKRPSEVINLLRQENSMLRDPHSNYSRQPETAKNSLRSTRPEYLIVVGICTHLGCVPAYKPEGGSLISPDPQFFCPCHGGAFDLAGRVFNGTPPPENLIVPNHKYLSENVVRLYFPTLEEEWNG